MSRSAICLVIDGLPAHLIGAYGNTWIHTPAFDSLAAESLVCEFATIDSPDLARLCRSYWQGVHAACPATTQSGTDPAAALPSLLKAAGVSTRLLSDAAAVAQHPLARQCDDLVVLPEPDRAATAKSVAASGLARFFAAAAEQIAAPHTGGLLWLQSRGLQGPWDAPYELRSRYAAEDDPPPPRETAVPERLLPADHDPDERLGISQAAAGQVTALDECLAGLLEAIDESPGRDETLLIVLGARGFPLGEHLRIGACDEALYEELLHVPLLVRLPGAGARPLRATGLVQPVDLYHTLLDWWGLGPDGETKSALPQGATQAASLLTVAAGERGPQRDRALTIGRDGQWALRTAAWHLRRSVVDDQERHELFAKPDDRWEVNDVASRGNEAVEQLTAAATEYLRAAESGLSDAAPLSPLSDLLLRGPE